MKKNEVSYVRMGETEVKLDRFGSYMKQLVGSQGQALTPSISKKKGVDPFTGEDEDLLYHSA